MPYEVRAKGGQWEVINSETKDVKGTHESKEEAERQQRLLEAIENDPGFESRHG